MTGRDGREAVETIDVGAAEVVRCADGIIEVRVRDGAVVEEQDVIEMFEAHAQLTGVDARVLVDVRPIRSMTRQAQMHTARLAQDYGVVAGAVVVGGPVSRLLGNFFLKVARPSYAASVFESLEEGRAWLLARGTPT